MAFQLSPGVVVTEKDLTSIVPAVATTAGAFAGAFQWGPVDQVTTIDSENNLVKVFGPPDSDTYKSFFTAANFLGYGNNLQVARSGNRGSLRTAVALSGIGSSITIISGLINYPDAGPFGNSNANISVVFDTPANASIGAGGYNTTATRAIGTVTVQDNSIVSITVTNPGSGYFVAPTIAVTNAANANNILTATCVLENTKLVYNDVDYETNHIASPVDTFGEFCAKYPGKKGNSIRIVMFDSASSSDFTAFSANIGFRGAPGTSTYVSDRGGLNDEIHIAVIDKDGTISGTRLSILERFPFVSKASDAKNSDGSSNYYKEVINSKSEYIRWLSHPTYPGVDNWGSEARDTTFGRLSSVPGSFPNGTLTIDLKNGAQGLPTSGNLITSYNLFANDELYDVSLIPMGSANSAVITSVVNNIAEVRRDCLVFFSPEESDVVNASTPATNIIDYRNSVNLNTSYAVMDSGWKQQYDRYNDVYRYVPLNGDTAGLAARTDYIADPWFSPAGYTRGQIKNVVKLAYSPSKADRDSLYRREINPVVSFPGQGTVLFGDKTQLTKPSAFDRINVRRLFIVLEKAIATAAKFQLFEFNDAFTRAQFRNLVEPFLRDVQGRRGVTDFKVICDETNNTSDVIDRNEFVADIYIKPARSINFIQLNFVATRSGISFEEVGA
jgi:hypothetical protein